MDDTKVVPLSSASSAKTTEYRVFAARPMVLPTSTGMMAVKKRLRKELEQ